MEDVVDTNAGMRLGQGGHDIKTCGWNMSGYDDDKAEKFALYMIHNDIDVGFLTDIRKTTDESEHAKRKLKNCFPEDTHISYTAWVDQAPRMARLEDSWSSFVVRGEQQ